MRMWQKKQMSAHLFVVLLYKQVECLLSSIHENFFCWNALHRLGFDFFFTKVSETIGRNLQGNYRMGWSIFLKLFQRILHYVNIKD